MGRTKSIILAWVTLFLCTEIASGAALKRTDPEVLSKVNGITIPFVENKGQLEESATLFYSNTFAGRVSVNRDGSIGYRLEGNTTDRGRQPIEIREKFCDALKTAPSGGEKAVAKVSHFQGKDPTKWVTDIQTFNTVRVGEIYQGVSLVLHARGTNVEKIFSVHPGADPKKIQLNIEGAKTLRLTEKGELEVKANTSSIRFTKPVAHQQINGKKTYIDIAYAVKGGSYGFKLGAYDKTKELIIDPLITGIFQGTADTKTMPTCLAVDSQGNIYAAGFSAKQLAVFKFNRDLNSLMGSALFSSHQGERVSSCSVFDIAVDHQGAVFLVGGTEDVDFPVTEGAFDTSLTEYAYGINPDGFVIKYNADLNKILSSTLIGESGFDIAYGLAIAPDDTVYVVGRTTRPTGSDAPPFPTTPDAYDTRSGIVNKTKAFVIRMGNELQTLQASTLLGYNGDEKKNDYEPDDIAYDIAIDTKGAIVVTGTTESDKFPVTVNCADTSFQGDSEAFISKFDPDLKLLQASTFLGGADKEKANVVAIASNDEIVVAGWTLSSDFPVVQDNYDTSYNSREDGFVTRLSSDLTAIQASTFIGGEGPEQVSDMVIGHDGKVLICGGTGSYDFPVPNNLYDKSYNSGIGSRIGTAEDFYSGDGFFTIFDPDLKAISASTYLGGNLRDHLTSIIMNNNNEDIFVAGETWSYDFPYMDTKQGDSDAFVLRFNANEESEPPPFSGRPGHWRSNKHGNGASFFLDVNICDDGHFSGTWKAYSCGVDPYLCYLLEETPPIPVSGKIDFQNWAGTIDRGDKNGDVSFRVTKQLSDEMIISLLKDGPADDGPGGIGSQIYYKGEYDTRACNVIVEPKKNDNQSGGGGGGCFLASMGGSLSLYR